MDHPCYRCNQDVPEANAFCPHCGAPQIRVALPETPEEQPQSPQPGEQPADSREFLDNAAWPYPPGPNAIRWDLAWKGALLCGLGAAVLTSVPILASGCFLWMLGAGAMTVSLYRKQLGGATVTPGMGMRVGALAGVFGFMLNAIVATASFVGLRTSGKFREAMQEQMQKQLANNPDPKVEEMVHRMLDWVSTPQGAATVMIAFLVVLFVIFVLFSAAGGALGASIFGRRRERH